MKQVTDYELIDHGIDGSQYFQGCGAAYTKFDNVATGAGDTFAEALDDALEQMAWSDVETEGLEERIKADYNDGQPWPEGPSASEEFRKANDISEDDDNAMEDCELHYYVSIRYNLGYT